MILDAARLTRLWTIASSLTRFGLYLASPVLQIYIIFAFLAAVAALIFGALIGVRKPFSDPSRHVLICSAHYDDCVIMGAEYAYGAVQNGLSVRIAYLTCSGPHPDAEISVVRRTEALAAWAAAGVPKENLTFINLPQSPIDGPASYSHRDLARAKKILKSVILTLPNDAAVIIPAYGESHFDHRTVRTVSLQAIVEAKRKDLFCYETPEYNSLLSLIYCFQRTIRAVLRHVPFFARVIKPYAGPANYVNGSPGFVFRDTPDRLAQKKELLMHFASQNGRLLIRYFGYETPYRQLVPSECVEESGTALCFPAFGGCADPTALAFGFTLAGLAFLSAHEIASAVTLAFTSAPIVRIYLITLAGLFAGVYTVRYYCRTTSLESLLFVLATTFGVILI